MKKRRLLISVTIVSIVTFMLFIILEKNNVFYVPPSNSQYINKQIQQIQNEWEIKINDKYDIIYHKISDLSFRGDGLRYFVLKLKSSTHIINIELNKFKDNSLEERVNEVIDCYKINSHKTPNFNEKYIWQEITKNNDTFFIVNFPESLELYLVESKI